MSRKKKTGKNTRRFMAALAAACVLGTMPGIPAISYAEEGIEEPPKIEDARADGQETDREIFSEKELSGSLEQGEAKTVTEEERVMSTEETDTEESGDMEKTEDQEDAGEMDAEVPEGDGDGTEEPAGREDVEDKDTETAGDQEDDKENSGENGEPTPGETEGTGNPEEGATEDETIPSEDGEEEAEDTETEQDEAETVSENTIQTEDKEAVISAERELPRQVSRAEKSFQIDGKTYNSEDADQSFAAGDDITAYYFASDSLLYFDGTGPMKDWHIAPNNPWYHIEPERAVVGEGITTVGVNAFYWPAHSLKSVSLPDTLEAVSKNGFYQCYDMEEVRFPEGLKSIGEGAFLGCKSLKAIDIPEGVTDLGENAFCECKSAASIHVPGSVKEVKHMAFAFCEAAKTITLDEGVEDIGEAAFQCNKISELSLPQSVKTIGEWAFNSSKSLHTLIIPDSVAEIGERAFNSCSALLNIHIGTGVTSIGTNAFQVSAEKKFRLFSENETAWSYDWTGDRRVIAYQITFMDTDGAPLQSNFVGMGDKVLPYAPEMENYSTTEETFTFTGWEPEITEETVVAADVEYTPVYQSVPRTYHVRFQDFDDSQIADLELPYGADIYGAQPDTPKREPDEQYTYTFSGWTPALEEGTTVQGEAEYKASYTSEKRQYTITFLDYDGSTLKKSEKALWDGDCGRSPHTCQEAGRRAYL